MIGATIPHPRNLSARLVVPLIAALASLPVIYMLGSALFSSRNVAYWDELDDVLGLMLHLKAGGNWHDVLTQFSAVENEHRTLMSRLLFAGSYWLTGTVNFSVIGIIGNLFLCVFCALLVGTAGALERKVQMGALLAALIFQQEHYENFLWSGSSIDHFQVVLLAGGAFMALARGSRATLLVAGLLGLLATFTLAHGLMVWPVGVLVLVADRRWRDLRIWSALAVTVGGIYFWGFQFNPAHHVGDFSAAGPGRILHYWLILLGAPVALGQQALAPFFGAALLALILRRLTRLGIQQERIALPLALWAVGSLLLVAIGRVDFTQGNVASRYYVLGALAWALVLFVQLETWREPARPYRFLLRALPLLILFNVEADANFSADARDWLSRRDSAIDDYVRYGRDGVGPYALHPNADHANEMLRQVEEAGVYRMPVSTPERWFPDARPVANLTYAIDKAIVDGRTVSVDGWGAFAGRVARGGQIHVVLQSALSKHIYIAGTVPRPDVAKVFATERWRAAGFHFEMRRWLLPKENFQVGLLIHSEHGDEFVMTPQRLDLTAAGAEIDAAVMHPNGIIYDRMILRAPVATVTAAPHRVTRVSLIDLTDTLVNVEFSGTGALTLSLDNPSGPAAPQLYNQPNQVYMKGHPSITITGADETTNVSVVSVRSPKAGGQPSGSAGSGYDGLAHIASISIASKNGKFGSVRTGNVCYSATKGPTGVYAPGVQFLGPVFVGDIDATGAATPVLQLGSAKDVRINGGDLLQTNGQPVRVSGIPRLNFVAGRTSGGEIISKKTNQAVMLESGGAAPGGFASTAAR